MKKNCHISRIGIIVSSAAMIALHRLAYIILPGLIPFATSLPASEDSPGFSAEDRAWWAIQPLKDPAIPEAGRDWARNPVDHFIARQQERQGLEPAREAGRRALIRRASFDLHGLPPSPEQIEAFLADERPDAWEQLVDRLLQSPHYGEHWALHWLDVVRYAETDGYRADHFRPGAYRYRDYVIRALNEDKPYDQFVREQLAADEFSKDPDILVATGFLRHGIYEHNQRNVRMHWELIMNEMTQVTGEVFLGIGIGCAQCHDHKFDPILQKDYYALQSFLATTAWPVDQDLASPAQRTRHEEETGTWEEATAGIRGALEEMLASTRTKKIAYTISQFPEDIQAMYNKPAAKRTPYETQMAALVQRQVDAGIANLKPDFKKDNKKDKGKDAAYKDLLRHLAVFEHMKPEPLAKALVANDVGTQAVRASFVSRDGRIEVEPAFLAVLGETAPEIERTGFSTGQRSALARWITRPDNQLATRVAVNRIWQHHFHRGLVATPNDLGTLGEAPSHPELLDWLARRLVAGGWHLKPLHRLIMNSATYRQSARREASEVARNIDPENRFLWRYPPRRLAAEQIRDAMLAVSGELRSTLGGPSRSGKEPVRSIYVTKRRNSPDEILAAFDAPSGFDSAPTRSNTTTPTQALLLANSDWPAKRARAMATRLLKGKQAIGPGEIERAYLLVYGRPADEREQADALHFIATQAEAIEREPLPEAGDSQGFEDREKHFSDVEKIPLNKRVLNLERSGPYQQVDTENGAWLDDQFTIQAVARLESIYPNSMVNTLFSRWNGKQAGTAGWALGITSAKSAYEPRNLILQLVGEDTAGNISYAVVDSDLQVPLEVPLYLAVVVSTGTHEGGRVTFYLQDLSDPGNPLQVNVVQHNIVRSIQQAGTPLLIGGRDQSRSHNWDGQLARLQVSPEALDVESLLPFNSAVDAGQVFSFDGNGKVKWLEPKVPDRVGIPRHTLAAMTDFCHALLISNGFLYLH